MTWICWWGSTQRECTLVTMSYFHCICCARIQVVKLFRFFVINRIGKREVLCSDRRNYSRFHCLYIALQVRYNLCANYMNMLQSNSQPSPFWSQPACFEASWPASKQASPIHTRSKIMARFKTDWLDSFETSWVDTNALAGHQHIGSEISEQLAPKPVGWTASKLAGWPPTW